MSTPSLRKHRSLLKNLGSALMLFAATTNVQGATTDLATIPMVSTSTVLPNLMFILDDSGSMAWAYMPDDNNNPYFSGKYGFASSQCNGVYYNPRITYAPPVSSTGAALNATPTSFTSAYKNGYNTGSGTVNLGTSFVDYNDDNSTNASGFASQAAFYYKYTGTQTNAIDKNYYNTGSTFYTECNTTPAAGSGATATITITVMSSTTVSSIKVNGLEILDAPFTNGTPGGWSGAAGNMRDGINACTSSITGNCTTTGYSATYSTNVVTITGPTGSNGFTPVITKSGGSMNFTPTAFSGGVAPVFTKVTVSATSGDEANGMPADERQNFANWYSYYRTRMKMMKTASGIAFSALDSNYRVAFMTINNNVAPDILNFAAFDATQKGNWYSKLYGASPGNATPLREALANVGRIYAKKLTSLYGVTITDPIQYSCQQNFTLLSTDGFWNGNSGFNLDGPGATHQVGNQDGVEPRPMNDGSSTTYTKTTTQLQKSQTQITTSTSQLQKTTTAYQTRTSTLQKQISQLQTRTSSLQKQISQLQSMTSTLQTRTGQLQKRTCSGGGWGGCSWGSWSDTASCTWGSGSTECRYVWGSWSNASSCTRSYSTGTSNGTTWSGNGTDCQYTSWTAGANVSACTAVAQSAGPAYTVGAAILCNTVVSTPYANAASCTATGTPDGAGQTTQCRYGSVSAWTGVQTCSPVFQDYISANAVECQTAVTTPYATVSSCTENATPDASGYTTQCQYTGWSSWSTLTASGSTATITLSGSSSTSVSGITVNGQQIMDNNTSSTSSPGTLAGYIVTQINACTSGGGGWGSNCDVSGYSATASGSVVTISHSSSITHTPSVSKSGSMTATATAFTPNVTSCTTVAQDYAHQTARECQNNATVVGVSSCTESSGVTCATVATGPTDAPSCTAASASSGNNYTARTCSTRVKTAAQGVQTCTAASASASNGGVATVCNNVTTTSTVTSCTPQTAAADEWKTITCSAPTTSAGTSDTLADVAEYYYVTDLRTTALGNCTSGSSANTLCATPDANGKDLTYNNVPASGLDTATWQHMTTFTLGLGARGSMAYNSRNYMGDSCTDPDNLNGCTDFYSVRMGLLADSTKTPPICSWQTTNGTICNWPVPVAGTKTAIDDLWHAAVNGRGTYFSATDPAELQEGLDDALGEIGGKIKSAAAVAVSNPSMDSGDNFMFGSAFNASEWAGDLKRWHISLSTGEIDAPLDSSGDPIPDWSAQEKLDVKVSRTIYTYDPNNTYNGGGTNKLKSFTYANLTGAQQAYFDATYLATPTGSGLTGLSQFLGTTSTVTSLTATNKTNAAGTNLVNYLRGVRTYEGAGNDNTKYYRQRTHLLGDIVDGEAAYVKAPLFRYADEGYGAFKAAHTTRQPMIYAPANDGMLHAFYAYGGDGGDDHDLVQYMDTATGNIAAGPGGGIIQVTGGDEAWAYIPTMVLPNLFTLADKNYVNKHQFFVDGSPVTGDICVSNCTTASAVWKTILVGGLSRGGKGYYALDITNPAAPKALWEFTNTNLGYTYGNPVIIKLKNGTWVVLVASGYNNADGFGHLYVLNASDGTLIRDISNACATCSVTNPSGLARISAMVAGSSAKDNVVTQVYGGDLLGNLWRFDVNGDVGAAGFDAQLLATLKGSNNTVQPITTKPELGLFDSNTVVYVGTGRYLGTSDVTDTGQKSPNLQSMYAIKDPLTGTATPNTTAVYSNVRTSGIQQTFGSATCADADICTVGETVRTGSSNAVNYATNSGWYVDLPDSGERVNTNPALAFGTLAFIGNVPPENTSDCSKNEGYSWEYFFDYRSGAPVASDGSPTNLVVAKKHKGLGSTPSIFQLSDGTVKVAVGLSTGKIDISKFTRSSTSGTTIRRTSWRELINDQ